MARHVRITFIYVVAVLIFFITIYHHYLRHYLSPFSSPTPFATQTTPNFVLNENLTTAAIPSSSTNPFPTKLYTTAVLIPNWEILVIVSPEIAPSNLDGGDYSCLFSTNDVTPARFAAVIPFPDRASFNCDFPERARRRIPFNQPVLVKSTERELVRLPQVLLKWTYLVYDSLTTDEDVVLFVKGVNTRQGINRKPSEFNCVFGDGDDISVRTAVTSSIQEVFRCKRPEMGDVSFVKVSLEIVERKLLVPSVAYYTPNSRKLESTSGKSLLCATTMVNNVAKFLREWVLYHSKIGVEKFLLYDNGSDDDLDIVVNELVEEGFDIKTYFWLWPKTQEAGFSHGAVYARDVCTWMMYIDVDEFVYSPLWRYDNVSQPSTTLLHSLILRKMSRKMPSIGQISIGCHEFGPSDQKVHPVTGVTQGYTCRRKFENRHKSIVLLDAIDDSLVNAIHHFTLKPGYKISKPKLSVMVVNHYKYQAWPEFKAKFRRRVSAYVLDWTKKMNPNSNDRAPGLGFSPIEPKGWSHKFCEVHDDVLKKLTCQWFGTKSDSGYRLAWQRR